MAKAKSSIDPKKTSVQWRSLTIRTHPVCMVKMMKLAAMTHVASSHSHTTLGTTCTEDDKEECDQQGHVCKSADTW